MWVYQQASGELTNPDGAFVAAGYAGGNCGKNPEGRNNPDMQSVKDVGPLPCGKYFIGEPKDHPKLGPLAIPLTPDPSNEMFGRNAFYMHGDLIDGPAGSASDGCIVLPRNVREYIWTSADHELIVVARINPSLEDTQ